MKLEVPHKIKLQLKSGYFKNIGNKCCMPQIAE